jgi:hypothetical protein
MGSNAHESHDGCPALIMAVNDAIEIFWVLVWPLE